MGLGVGLGVGVGVGLERWYAHVMLAAYCGYTYSTQLHCLSSASSLHSLL